AASVPDLLAGLAAGLGPAVLCLLLVAAALAFTGRPTTLRGAAAGLLHGAAHLLLAVAVLRVAAVVTDDLPGGWYLLGVLAVVAAVGGLLGAELVAVYLLLADRVGLNSNELFAAQGIPDAKDFLRLRVDRDGDLLVHAVGVERVPRHWRVREGSPTSGERLVSDDGPLRAFLVEPPVRVARRAPP
ncbi:MAG: hypothetical protein JWN17_1397, partial [Frankiales bacterium]|nr:hypothetical protein [Frankiales bacterium]